MSPISPEKAAKSKVLTTPQVVFDAFDSLIVENYVEGRSVVKQDAVVGIVKEQLGYFHNEWLNVESAYEAVGWIVRYDKPAYCETYPATFTFIAKRAE